MIKNTVNTSDEYTAGKDDNIKKSVDVTSRSRSFRFRNPFYQERLPEWMSATAMFLAFWQLVFLSDFSTAQGYTFFEFIGIPREYPIYFLGVVGLLRVVALTINGSWKRTPQIRKIGAFVGAVFFALFFVGGYLPALAFFLADVYAGYKAGYDSERINAE
jgi:hypothetical protein